MRTRFTDGTYREPGIYFGLPFEEYAEDWSLGSSDLVNLLISPTNYYWYSRANPKKKERAETHSLKYGRAIHKAVLEPHRFDDEYGPKLLPEPGALITLEDLRAKCTELGVAKSGTKAMLISRIRGAGDTTPIHDEAAEAHRLTMGDRILLDPSTYYDVKEASSVIRHNYHLQKAFDDGYPEVSVFFEFMGCPLRARFDYLKQTCIVDLKSIRNHLKQEWPVAVANSIARHQYHIQAVSYLLAREAAVHFINDGRVFGDPLNMPNKKWLEQLAAQDEFHFYWVFFQVEGAPLTMAIRFNHQDHEFITSTQRIQHALETYKDYINKFDRELWVEELEPVQYSNLSMPMWHGQ